MGPITTSSAIRDASLQETDGYEDVSNMGLITTSSNVSYVTAIRDASLQETDGYEDISNMGPITTSPNISYVTATRDASLQETDRYDYLKSQGLHSSKLSEYHCFTLRLLYCNPSSTPAVMLQHFVYC